MISSLIKDGVKKENIVLVSGIGCSSKIIDYINLNSFSSLHGRPVVSAEGIKLGNPDLKVIVCAGDGGTYNEGISHLIHAAKRNIDITVLIHNNRKTIKITISEQGDGAFAVVEIDTLWRDKDGNESHWKGTVSKGYTKTKDGWKLIMHTGVLKY